MSSTKTPLRYPGGKSQLTAFVEHTIDLNNIEHTIYCEPFSGGAGVAISLLLGNKVDSIILNDLDPAIYSIWHAILTDTEKLLTTIDSTDISLEVWQLQKNIYDALKDSNKYSFELAFAAFFLNRTNRSGIITGGPIGGMEQAGRYLIDCRFNKATLKKKISAIANKREHIQLYNLDAIEFIQDVLHNVPPNNLFTFFDPPYYQQGKNLYKNSFDDEKHRQLSTAINTLQNHHWIITYDNNSTIEQIYSANNEVMRYTLQYMASKKRREQELFFHSPITQVESYDKVQFN